MSELEAALEFETKILIARGFRASCGCTRKVLCRFPETSWYCMVLCSHCGRQKNKLYWWYDTSDNRRIKLAEFQKRHLRQAKVQAWASWGEGHRRGTVACSGGYYAYADGTFTT